MLDDKVACIERYERFIKRVQKSQVVWGLKNKVGWAVAPSNDDDISVMVFWSDRAYAAQCAKEEWAEYHPTAIPLDKFVTIWLPGLDKDGMLVGTNWNAHLIGVEVTPLQLREELSVP
jgi:hypothetical protein